MNSFIPWVGGKSKLLWIINKMAPDHYSRFIDVFGGSGTVTMSRPIQQGCMEVYNDFNSNLTNLFCCVKNRPFGTIYADTELPSRARAVYMYLRDRADSEGKCWPGIKTIASDMRLSRSTVKRALTDLEQHGYLQKIPRYRDNGSSTSNLYSVQ